jgi:Flp pilus assembly protein TadG
LALILPVFLLMVLGMIDLARAWNAKQVITDAAREAARRGVVDHQTIVIDDAYVIGVAEAAIANAGFDPSLATIDPDGVNAGQGSPLTVEITYPYEFQFMTLFMNLFGGNTIQLETRIVMRNE